MARLRDVLPVLKTVGPWSFGKRVYQQFNEDGILTWAAALAYSWLFAVFPFLIFLMTLVPYLPQHSRKAADKEITQFISKTLGSAAPTINDNIQSLLYQPRGGLLGIGLLVSLWAAAGGMSMTILALDQCYDIKNGRPFYKQRPLAILLTIIVVLMLLIVLLALPVGHVVEKWLLAQHLASTPVVWAFSIFRYTLAVMLLLGILAIMYHLGPAIHQPFRLITPGAVFSLVVWVALHVLFRLYIDKFARYEKTYGTVGGVALVLLFFYLSGVVLLIGAEINSEIDFEVLGVPHGSKDFTRSHKVQPTATDSAYG